MKKLIKAHDLALQRAVELGLFGIEVRIKPSASRQNKETVSRHKDGLPFRRWVTVSFRPKDNAALAVIFEAGSRLNKKGIYFDTGGCQGQRDWELDWSFNMKAARNPLIK